MSAPTPSLNGMQPSNPDARSVTAETLISDAAEQAGSRTAEPSPQPHAERVSGTVKGLIANGTRALVLLDNDVVIATAVNARNDPTLRLDETLRIGDRVTGELSAEGRELHL